MENHATFRFYKELNDFLPLDKKMVAFVHSFGGTPSIKDVIEAIGVPHVGFPATFSQKLMIATFFRTRHRVKKPRLK